MQENQLYVKRSKSRKRAAAGIWGVWVQKKKNCAVYRGNKMIDEINSFITYLQEVKHTAKNTEVSYHRDLVQMAGFMEKMGITHVEKVTKTSLNSYILYLEKEGFSISTVSRNVASMKAYFHYAFGRRLIEKDPTRTIKHRISRSGSPGVLTQEQVTRLLEQPSRNTAKGIRDKAMLELYMQPECGCRS